ncbi:Hypothetical predicted protein [Pelobates cultripes]|uniref:Uncharacterized protein n=1 Tax=Pelobates cultripes TaxID=61616 RepID=A0AAD1RAD6_PELCU|nr:Hypothetical predicted protein [Pelobates cultripes]
MTNTYRTRDEPTRQDCPNAQYPSALHHDTRTHPTTTRNSTRSTNTPPTLIGSPNRHRRTPNTEGTPQQDYTPTHGTHTTTAYTHQRTATSAKGIPTTNAHTGQKLPDGPSTPKRPTTRQPLPTPHPNGSVETLSGSRARQGHSRSTKVSASSQFICFPTQIYQLIK